MLQKWKAQERNVNRKVTRLIGSPSEIMRCVFSNLLNRDGPNPVNVRSHIAQICNWMLEKRKRSRPTTGCVFDSCSPSINTLELQNLHHGTGEKSKSNRKIVHRLLQQNNRLRPQSYTSLNQLDMYISRLVRDWYDQQASHHRQALRSLTFATC
jgi:hypothetical protein